jgi:F-type H+-transporting ATPase subunit a
MIDLDEARRHVFDSDAFHFPFHKVVDLREILGGWVTKYMVLEWLVALLMLVVFIPLARRIASGEPVRGRLGNMFEAMLIFLRDEVARPAIGRHDADRFLPYIWTAFFFILFCNLMGMVPWAGSPTGSLAVTGALAAIALSMVTGAGMLKHGLVKFWTGMVPHVELPLVLAIFLMPMLLAIEVAGLLIRHCVLAVRLLANMFAGHLVLAVIVGFIASTAHAYLILWLGVTTGSILGAAALSLLELFVAFLQAYIFTFLSAVFIGMALHQH